MGKHYLKSKLIHFFVFASLYMNIEVIVRVISGDMIGFQGITLFSLVGYTSIYMGTLSGCLSLIIAFLCDSNKYFYLKAYQKVLIGGSLITFGELISGVILNMWLNLSIWSYADSKFNFLGQIELVNCLFWFFLITPMIITLDSHLTYYIYDEDKNDVIDLVKFYKDLFTGK